MAQHQINPALMHEMIAAIMLKSLEHDPETLSKIFSEGQVSDEEILASLRRHNSARHDEIKQSMQGRGSVAPNGAPAPRTSAGNVDFHAVDGRVQKRFDSSR